MQPGFFSFGKYHKKLKVNLPLFYQNMMQNMPMLTQKVRKQKILNNHYVKDLNFKSYRSAGILRTFKSLFIAYRSIIEDLE